MKSLIVSLVSLLLFIVIGISIMYVGNSPDTKNKRVEGLESVMALKQKHPGDEQLIQKMAVELLFLKEEAIKRIDVRLSTRQTLRSYEEVRLCLETLFGDTGSLVEDVNAIARESEEEKFLILKRIKKENFKGKVSAATCASIYGRVE